MIVTSQRTQQIILIGVFSALIWLYFLHQKKENTQLERWQKERSAQHQQQKRHLQKTLIEFENTVHYLSATWDPLRPDFLQKKTYSNWLKYAPQYQGLAIFSSSERAIFELTTNQTPPISLTKNAHIKLTESLYLDKKNKMVIHQFRAFNQNWWLALSLNQPIFEFQNAWLMPSKGNKLISPINRHQFFEKNKLPKQNTNQFLSNNHNHYLYTPFIMPSNPELSWGLVSIMAKSDHHHPNVFFIIGILAFAILLPCYFYRQWQKEKQLTDCIQDNLQRHQITLEHATIGMMILNTNGNLLSTNKNAQTWLPFYSRPHLQKNIFLQLHGRDFKYLLWKIHKQAIQQNKTQTIEYNQSPHYFTLTARPYHYRHHTEIVICIQNNVEWHLRKQKYASLQQALDENDQSVLIVTATGRIEFMNRIFKSCYQQPQTTINRSWTYDLLKRDFPNKEKRKQFLRDITSGSRTTFVLHRKKNIFIEKTVYPLLNSENKITHYIYTGKDITKQTQKKHNLYTLAHYDQATGLPNHVLLNQAVKKKCQHPQNFSLLKMEWRLNPRWVSKLTHEEMSDLKRQYAKNLKQQLKNASFLAKVTENRFVFFSEQYEYDDLLIFCAQLLRELPNQLHTQQHRVVEIQHSLGVCPILDNTADVELILQRTRLALHFATQQQHNQFFIYSYKMEKEHQSHYQLIDELKNSVGTSQYQLHYQPKVNNKNQLTGVEALLRWQDKQGHTHSPLKIIELLEETQLIHVVGNNLLKKACKQAAMWHQQNRKIHVAINISVEQLNIDEFVLDLNQILKETNCPAHCLELELTESILMENTQKSHHKLKELHQLGVHIAIDDFGTGYSSLAYLNQFPFDILKIDRSFISKLPHQNDSVAITQCIIELAKNLNKRIVAEGVETQAQVEFLKKYHIDEYQGYFFNRPMPIDELEDYYQLKTSVIN